MRTAWDDAPMAMWQSLPLTHRRTLALYVPLQSHKLVEQVFTREVRAVADSRGARPDDIAAQIQHLRTYALPQLLCRVPHAHPPQDPEDRDSEARPLDPEGRRLHNDAPTLGWPTA